MTLFDPIIDPFAQYAFMRRALVACVILALCGTPLGLFLTLRRMTLLGDAMSHAILPGVAGAFLAFGLSLWPMTLGGLAAGIVVSLLALFLTRFTQLKEDASFTLLYLLSLAGGVVMVSLQGSKIDLLHLLFGDILAIDNDSLFLIAGVATVSVFLMAAFYRGMVLSCFDPAFAATGGNRLFRAESVFFLLLVLNLIAAFQALGTLMALGIMILPALSARFWTRNIDKAVPMSILCAIVAVPVGLLLSYYTQTPAGPSVVLTNGVISLGSAVFGRHGSLLATFLRRE